ncbi:MAG: hypothetical protein IIB36_18045 [Gemmatimonadetes bacterium]|nr:hypothetical protein [Gemmatimonadota bacterium]
MRRLLFRALVTLLAIGLNPAGSLEAQTVRGRFALEVPESGEYFIRVERLGYQAMTSLLLQIGVDRDYDLGLVIRPEPIQLDELRVTVRSQEVCAWLTQACFSAPATARQAFSSSQ